MSAEPRNLEYRYERKFQLRQLSVPEVESIIRLNLIAPLNFAQQANAVMQRQDEGGVIINIASVSGIRPSPGTAAYGAAKAGLLSLTQTLAVEWARFHINVNAIAPGLVLPSENAVDEEWNKLVQRLPLKRPATTEEVASALEFLLKNEYITGQTIVVDGGYSLL